MIAGTENTGAHLREAGQTPGAALLAKNRQFLLRYGCAIISTTLALIVRMLLMPAVQARFPYALMYFAITLTAWYGGFGPALFAMIVGYLEVAYFLVPPYHTFVITNVYDLIGFVVFVFLGLANILFSESLRRAQARAEANAEQARNTADALRASESRRIESEERLRMAADAARLGVWSYSPEAGELTLSPAGAQVMGLPPEQTTLTNTGLLERIYAADKLYVMRAIRNTLDNQAVFDAEYRVVWPDKSIHWLATRGEALRNAHTGETLFSGVVQEITQRKQTEQERDAHLREIEALNGQLKLAMAETHHRVKNNLQVIAAMIDMQTMEDTPTLPRDEFLRLGQHVRTLATIHEILTQKAKEQGDAQTLSARALLRHLLTTLQRAHQNRALRQQIDDATLSTRHGTALALIANELVSNAVKHAKGAIEVRFVVQGNIAMLEVCDDGAGFPPGFNASRAANTGLELIQTLTSADLTGNLAFSNRPEGGGRVCVTFAVTTI